MIGGVALLRAPALQPFSEQMGGRIFVLETLVEHVVWFQRPTSYPGRLSWSDYIELAVVMEGFMPFACQSLKANPPHSQTIWRARLR